MGRVIAYTSTNIEREEVVKIANFHTDLHTRSRLRAVRLLPFNYSVIFKKSRRRTACSSRASYGTIPLEILLRLLLLLLFLLLLLLLRFSRIQWTTVQPSIRQGCHLSGVKKENGTEAEVGEKCHRGKETRRCSNECARNSLP